MTETDFVDYYKLLNIDINASQQDVKNAYLVLAKIHHPDKGGDEKTFQQITQAYECLSKKSTRLDYEQKYLRYQIQHELDELDQMQSSSNNFLKLRQEFIDFSKKINDSNLQKVDQFDLPDNIKIEPINTEIIISNLENLKLEREMFDIENQNSEIQEFMKQHQNISSQEIFTRINHNIQNNSQVSLFQSKPDELFGKWDVQSTQLVTLSADNDLVFAPLDNLNAGEFNFDVNNISSHALPEDTKLSMDDINKYLQLRDDELKNIYQKNEPSPK